MDEKIELTKEQADTLLECIYVLGMVVGNDHIWSNEERKVWEKSDRILRKAGATYAGPEDA